MGTKQFSPRSDLLSGSLLRFLLALVLAVQVSGFQFYLHAGERRCFTESAPPNTKILGEYTVSTGRGRMPVDITVRMEGDVHSTLYSRQNVDHGKFAFVLPFEGAKAPPHIQQAEMHRKMNAHIHRVHTRNGRLPHHEYGADHRDGHGHSHQRRRLLSVDEHGSHGHHDVHDAHHDTHDLHHDSHDFHHDTHDLHHDLHHDTHDLHHNVHDIHRHDDHDSRYAGIDHQHHDAHDHHDHHDHDDDDYDYDDDLDDFDSDEYDGINDDELDEEEERMMQEEVKQHGRFEDASDEEKEERLFDLRKFEICVSSQGDRTEGVKRRVRLVIHKGQTAHDYNRLAKKEHMTQLEVSLRQVSGELHELMNELDQARRMEDVLRELNENTNKSVVIFSVLSLISLFAVGGYQAFYTKRFFKRKKIL